METRKKRQKKDELDWLKTANCFREQLPIKKPKTKLTAEEKQTRKKALKMQKNKESAKRSRQNAKIKEQKLEKQVEELTAQNEQMKKECDELTIANKVLRNDVLAPAVTLYEEIYSRLQASEVGKKFLNNHYTLFSWKNPHQNLSLVDSTVESNIKKTNSK